MVVHDYCAVGGVGMQIFYFRKNTFKWVILVAVIVIISIILFWAFGTRGQQSESTLMITQMKKIFH